YPIKSAKCLFFNFFQRKKIGVGKSDFVRFCFAKSKTRVRHAPRHQWSCVQNGLSRSADGSWARLGVNQGEAEGVDFRPRLKLSPKICPQDCPRGAAAARFL
ncbi:MAG: hypothetical protein IJY46_02675, partial [Lentisphaeria bacterium]|nr:hypothetical protein [Lentisphaeria bacterium]